MNTLDLTPFRLTYAERELIKLRFGIGYEETYSRAEVARVFRITYSRALSIEKKALKKLAGFLPFANDYQI